MDESLQGSEDVVVPHSLLRAFATANIAVWVPHDPTMRLRYITIERDDEEVVVAWKHRDAQKFSHASFPSLVAAARALAERGWLHEGWEPNRRRFGE